MNAIKKTLGIMWIGLAIATAYGCFEVFGGKFATGKQDDLVFAIIIFFILMPLVCLGLGTFGWYALQNEYKEE